MNIATPRLCTITISAAAWENTVNAWCDFLRYKVLNTGYLSSELARTWNAPNNVDSRIAVMAPESGDETVLVRIVENQHPSKYESLRTFGWASLELTVANVDELEIQLKDSPFTIIGHPHDLGFADGKIRAMQVRGPADEIILLTQIKDQVEGFHLPIANSNVDRPFVAILATRDLETAQAFYYDKLLVPKGNRISTEIWALSQAFHLSRDTLHTISTGQLPNQSLIEMDEYPEDATRRPLMPGHLVPGICHVTFAVTTIDDLPLYWLTEPNVFSGPPYEEHRQVTCFGSTGELIELILKNELYK